MRTKNSSRIGWLGCVAGLLLLALPVGADTYTWDNNTTPPAGDGAGPWDTTTAHWDNGTSDVLWPNSLSDTAVFGLGGAIGNSASLVTVDAGGVQVGNITFNYTDPIFTIAIPSRQALSPSLTAARSRRSAVMRILLQ